MEQTFTFDTEIGDVDLLGEVAGVGTYETVNKESEIKSLFGYNGQFYQSKA